MPTPYTFFCIVLGLRYLCQVRVVNPLVTTAAHAPHVLYNPWTEVFFCWVRFAREFGKVLSVVSRPRPDVSKQRHIFGICLVGFRKCCSSSHGCVLGDHVDMILLARVWLHSEAHTCIAHTMTIENQLKGSNCNVLSLLCVCAGLPPVKHRRLDDASGRRFSLHSVPRRHITLDTYNGSHNKSIFTFCCGW